MRLYLPHTHTRESGLILITPKGRFQIQFPQLSNGELTRVISEVCEFLHFKNTHNPNKQRSVVQLKSYHGIGYGRENVSHPKLSYLYRIID